MNETVTKFGKKAVGALISTGEMQVTRTDSDCSKRVGIAEHLIKFRSSPNLKNVKKFIRCKMDHIEIINRAAPDPPTPPNIRINEPARSEVQPPLPLEPPPPDENYTLHVKQELVDDEYESSPSEGTSSELQNEPVNSDNTTPIEVDTSKVPICRDYVRGTCKRPGTCKYAHKYDLTQLVGVYTFCRKYQTSVCTYPVCKYVHATVFEEHHFYRTGILPPHAFAHHKKVNVMQPPPPPPPPPPPKKHPTNLSVNTNVSMNLTFTNPPPPLQNEIFQEEMRNTVSPKSATLKRQWNSIEQFSSPPSDRDNNEPFAKKCKHCDIMDFRLQYNKYKVEKMLVAKDDLTKKMITLEKNSKKLCTLISALLTLPSKTQSHTNGSGSSLSDEEDKTLLEQLKSFVSISERLSGEE